MDLVRIVENLFRGRVKVRDEPIQMADVIYLLSDSRATFELKYIRDTFRGLKTNVYRSLTSREAVEMIFNCGVGRSYCSYQIFSGIGRERHYIDIESQYGSDVRLVWEVRRH